MLRRSLGERAADQIREEVLSGRWPAGSQLVEEDISSRLEISRGTVRTALQILTAEGIVRHEPYRGTFVTPLTSRDAWEVLTLRNSVASLAAKLVAERLTEEMEKELCTALEQLRLEAERGSNVALLAAHSDLHSTIVELSGHGRLMEVYKQLEQLTQRYLSNIPHQFADSQQLVSEHRELVEAILSGDPDVAENAWRSHTSSYGEALVEALRRLETSLEPTQERWVR